MDGASAENCIAAVAAVASAVAATFSYFSSRTANALAKSALTKRSQSELFTAILLEAADLLRLESANILTQGDTEFSNKSLRYVELGKQIQRLKALSPCFKKIIDDDDNMSAFLATLANEPTSTGIEFNQLEEIISALQLGHRNELNDH